MIGVFQTSPTNTSDGNDTDPNANIYRELRYDARPITCLFACKAYDAPPTMTFACDATADNNMRQSTPSTHTNTPAHYHRQGR
jgi:hypothetical protein